MNEIRVSNENAIQRYDDFQAKKKLPTIDLDRVKAAVKRFLQGRFVRRNGIAATVVLFVTLYGVCVSEVTEYRVGKRLTAELSAQYEAEYNTKLEAFISQQERMYRAVGDGSMQAEIEREADAITPVIAHMDTKRMKQSEVWNILTRVDSPFYPDSVEDVVNAPGQWIFFDPDAKTPIREDDRQLVIEQLKLWHDGRYPAGLTIEHVYGEWSSGDYVLRDTWEKTSRTSYWRMPE